MRHRLRQAMTSIASTGAGHLPGALESTPRTSRLFGALATHDRRHLASVHAACHSAGLAPDTVMAGLLHDIGKASLSGRRVNLAERTLRVLLKRAGVGTSARWSRGVSPGWRHGLAMAEGHASLGAGRLAALGWPDGIVKMVLGHEQPGVSGELAVLKAIDDATP